MEEQQPEILSGIISNVIFHNDENGYTVLQLEDGSEEAVTVTGCIPFAAKGETLEVSGNWENHSVHGLQFKAASVHCTLPSEPKNIYLYLSSGAIKGIGPALANLMVRTFGRDTLRILSDDPDKLATLKGITPDKAKKLSGQYRRLNDMRSLMEFLASSGLRADYAIRLYKLYGEKALEMVRANPYLISSDRIGGQFGEADALALSLGFDFDSPERISAGIIFEMRHNLNNGHTFLPREKLVPATVSLLSVQAEDVEECLDVLADSGDVVQETVAGVTAVYLERLYEAETNTALKLCEMASKSASASLDVMDLIGRMEAENGINYAPQQKEAIRLASERNLLVITGGPGTGKTTIIRALLQLFGEMQLRCLLAAPTGRAAKRMSELTGEPAFTIHRLLGAAWSAESDELTFRKNENDVLNCGALILDECSMIDINLIYALLRALPRGCRLVLVGDADQLPSVGPGNFFGDVLRSQAVATVRLTEIFRQSHESRIIRNAHSINQGECPDLKENKGDFFFLSRGAAETTVDTIIGLCSERLPRTYGYRPDEIQVLTPTRKGDIGTVALNQRLQAVINPASEGKKEKKFSDYVFREGDKVMQIRNDYDIVWCKGGDTEAIVHGLASPGSAPENGMGIFNGDLGCIQHIDTENELVWILFEDKLAWYGYDQLNELDLAYAVTVHKSQGSEYKAVVYAAGRAPAQLLSRDLLYTAVTRARDILVVVGDANVIRTMVNNGRKTKRYSGLRARMAGEVAQ